MYDDEFSFVANYNANEDLISESSAQGYKNRARNMYRGDTQESSSLKGLFHNRMSRDVSGEGKEMLL